MVIMCAKPIVYNYNQKLLSQSSMADNVMSDGYMDSCYEEMCSYFAKLQYRK